MSHKSIFSILVSSLGSLLMVACTGDTSGESADESSSLGGISITVTDSSSSGSGDDTTTGVDTTAAAPTTGDDADSTGLIDCTHFEIEAQPEIPNVVLVLDKSGSMVADTAGHWDADNDDADNDGLVDGDPNNLPATPRVTRWSSLHNVVEFIVTDFEPRMNFGAVLFPSSDARAEYNAAACTMNDGPDVPVAEDQGTAILATIPPADATAIHGGTPATAGITTALAALEGLDPTRDRFLVFITDGAANCASDAVSPADLFEIYDEQLPVVVADAHAQGISTFVVGIDIKDLTSPVAPDGNPDDTNTFTALNAVAEAGGKARIGGEKFYNAANQVELDNALTHISHLITSCTLELMAPLLPAQYVFRLTVGGPDPLVYDQHQVTDCDNTSGWRFTDASRTKIQLCGDACELYKVTGEVDIILDCATP